MAKRGRPKRQPAENGLLFQPEKFVVFSTTKHKNKLRKSKRYFPVGEILTGRKIYRILPAKTRASVYLKKISIRNVPLFKLSRPMLKLISDKLGEMFMEGWEWRDKTEL